jgi:hypothetical protein
MLVAAPSSDVVDPVVDVSSDAEVAASLGVPPQLDAIAITASAVIEYDAVPQNGHWGSSRTKRPHRRHGCSGGRLCAGVGRAPSYRSFWEESVF